MQRWRARSSAILTGSGTVLADNPRLSVRVNQQHSHPDPALAGEGFKPLRVVLDRALRTPAGANVLDGSVPTLILHGQDAQSPDARFSRVELATVAADARGCLDLAQVLSVLAVRGVNELQVEAGATLGGSLWQSGFVDELLLYVAPVLLGDTAKPLLALPELSDLTQAGRLRVVDRRRIGDDLRVLYRK